MITESYEQMKVISVHYRIPLVTLPYRKTNHLDRQLQEKLKTDGTVGVESILQTI